ncbi:hypothetical protein ABIC55_003973 [Sporosarcina psychrophila]|uniref:Uncharacterized protein n=1 Tax=Sporosarcina psychrophila TaxID=1476 RepID=A0ABV2KE06_SPOPS
MFAAKNPLFVYQLQTKTMLLTVTIPFPLKSKIKGIIADLIEL